jgi:dTDP-4-amino-4,6-dideoxygalactose transaminase
MQKSCVEDLAIFGGPPAFEKKLYVGCPNIGSADALQTRLGEILKRRWLSNDGPLVGELEQKLAELTAVKHCIVMCNATIALEIAIRALDLSGEVIVPAFTFIATPHALQWQEITPVFCDIDPDTHNMDPARVEQLITPRTTGILAVHLWGKPCDVDALSEIARRRRLKLLFDAAHAFGCSHKGRMVGGFGDAEVFSFHATKFFNTFEGGAVMTNDDELARRIRLMRNFGFSGYDNVVYLGTNGKMTEISAAAGLTNLESIHVFACVNQQNYCAYMRGLRDIVGIRLHKYDESEKRNFQYVVVEVDEEICGIGRDELLNVLWAENVIARRYFYPGCHRMEPYRSYFPTAGILLPWTENVCRRVMVLPTGTAISTQEVAAICELIRLCGQNSLEIRERSRAIVVKGELGK